MNVNSKVTLTPFAPKISPEIDDFYGGRDGKVRPERSISLSAQIANDSRDSFTLEEVLKAQFSNAPLAERSAHPEGENDGDDDNNAIQDTRKYSFIAPAVLTSAVQDLFAQSLAKSQKKITVDLKSVDSIVGAFSNNLAEALKAKNVKLKSSISSIASVEDVTLKFRTAKVRAVKSAKNPNVINVQGEITGVHSPKSGISQKKLNLAKGRFTIKFSK